MPTFHHHLSAALGNAGLDELGLFHATGIRRHRIAQLGQGLGLPLTPEEVFLLGQVFGLSEQEVQSWAAPRGVHLTERMALHPFLGTVGPERLLQVHNPWRAFVPAHLAQDTWAWAFVLGDEMAGAGIEHGSRVFVSKVPDEGPEDGAIVLAQGRRGSVCRRWRQTGAGPMLLTELASGSAIPMPLDGGAIVGQVIWVRRPDLRV